MVGLEFISQPTEQRLDTEHDRAGCHSIDAGGSCTLVAPHPSPRHSEERRVIDEVGEVIEATARIGLRPFRCSFVCITSTRCSASSRSGDGAPVFTSGLLGSLLMLRSRWTPSPCDRLSRSRTTTGPPSHPDSIDRRRVFPPASGLPAGEGTIGMVPTFTLGPFDGIEPSFAPATSPRLRRRPSPWPPDRRDAPAKEFPRPRRTGARCYPALIRQVRAGGSLEGRSAAGSSRTPFRLACRTQTI